MFIYYLMKRKKLFGQPDRSRNLYAKCVGKMRKYTCTVCIYFTWNFKRYVRSWISMEYKLNRTVCMLYSHCNIHFIFTWKIFCCILIVLSFAIIYESNLVNIRNCNFQQHRGLWIVYFKYTGWYKRKGGDSTRKKKSKI